MAPKDNTALIMEKQLLFLKNNNEGSYQKSGESIELLTA
jgi:hypothetical protein